MFCLLQCSFSSFVAFDKEIIEDLKKLSKAKLAKFPKNSVTMTNLCLYKALNYIYFPLRLQLFSSSSDAFFAWLDDSLYFELISVGMFFFLLTVASQLKQSKFSFFHIKNTFCIVEVLLCFVEILNCVYYFFYLFVSVQMHLTCLYCRESLTTL